MTTKIITVTLVLCCGLAYAATDTHPPTSSQPQPATKESATPQNKMRGVDALINAEPMQETMDAVEAYLEEHEDLIEREAEGEVMTLTVRDCVNIALENNEKIFQAESDVDAARARIGQARSQMLPRVGATVSFIHTEYEDIKGGGVFDLFSGAFTSEFQPEDDFRNETVTGEQVLYAGGRIRAAIDAARFLTESKEWQKAVTLAQVEFDAKQGFYDVLLATSLVEVAAESVRTFERNLTDAQEMYDVGMISNFEVLRAKTELGARKSELVAAKNALRLAEANLRRVLFLPEDTRLDLDASIEWAPTETPLETYVAQALENRPEIRALGKSIEAAKQQVRGAKGQYLPRVGLRAEYSNTENGGLVANDGWTFTLGAECDIYAGGKRKHDVLEARSQVTSLEHQLSDLHRLVELDVTQAHISIQDAMAKMESERGIVALAQEGLRLAELRFQEGVGTQSEILDAELALTNAQSSLFKSLREFAVANASLERAMGNSWWRNKEEFTESLSIVEGPSEETK
ncbi:MAG: TolC family protein [Candidatus Hydrogenedentota bacterium]